MVVVAVEGGSGVLLAAFACQSFALSHSVFALDFHFRAPYHTSHYTAHTNSHTFSRFVYHGTNIHTQERMAALAQLLPEAASKLSRLVVRHPYLLTKSPRAVARNILEVRFLC